MIGERIQFYRKKKHMTQEELALQVHVVRQTVSKWEQNLSVPSADVLLQIAEVLEVDVQALLEKETEVSDVAAELARVNQELAMLIAQQQRTKQANQVRGWILFLSFLSLILCLVVQHELISLLLCGCCLLIILILLYRNLALLTSITTHDLRLTTLRITTIFNGSILLLMIVIALLTSLDVLKWSERSERIFAMCLVAIVMIFTGIIGPRLPYTRHTGLRLPWTVADEETWTVAHHVLGIISTPVALLYVATSWIFEDFETISLIAVLLWVGIPALFSGLFYLRKFQIK